MRIQQLDINDDIVLGDVMFFVPTLWIVIGHFMGYATLHGLPKRFTSLNADRENVRSVSTTHEDGRAVDFSSAGWSDEHIEGVQAHMNKIATHYGAISFSDHQRRVIIHHEYVGQGEHFHLQVAR